MSQGAAQDGQRRGGRVQGLAAAALVHHRAPGAAAQGVAAAAALNDDTPAYVEVRTRGRGWGGESRALAGGWAASSCWWLL